MNFKILGALVCILGAVLIAWSVSSKQNAQTDLAAKSLDDFIAASGQVTSSSVSESSAVLRQRKERAEWLLIGGFVLCGLGIAVSIAAKKSP